MKANTLFKYTSIITLMIWASLLVLIPLLLTLITSFLSHSNHHLIIWRFSLNNYQQLFNPIYYRILLHSVILAFNCTMICLLIAYPAAFIIARLTNRWKSLLLTLLIIPFWTSSLIRTYAMLAILKTKGLLNTTLLALGLIDHPLQILYSNTAVLIGCVYNLLPFMILPLYANIEKLDEKLIEAARDLGASRIQLFSRIIIPLTLPGILAGSLLVFLPAMTLFYIPNLLGGAKSILLGNLVQNQFLAMRDWPGGAATSIVLTALMLLLLCFYRQRTSHNTRGNLL